MAGGAESRERKGPRHAAPRKSLLTKLQIPAGKAMALAAMPTAVFVGMGLTPKLALADDQPEIPFAPGPCVTRSDEPLPEESASPSEKPTPSESAKPPATPSPSEGTGEGEETQEPKPAETPSADSTAEPKPAPPKPDPAPSETETKNPLDPLGVGDAIKDILDGPDMEPTATPSPSATESTPAPKPSASAPADKPAPDAPAKDDPADKPADNPADKPADDPLGKTKDDIKDAADKVGAEVEELDEDAKDEAVEDKDGKEPFPCPTADPEALAAADLEPGIPALPDEPWILESSMLTLRGLDYKGIVKVRTGSGKIKNVLKFTAKETDIKDLHQLVVGPNGTTAHVTSNPGSTSTLRDGTVTMYTEELKGNLFGLIPVTFSPQTPPPLNVPIAFFTKVKVTQAGQFGGTLTVPGLSNYYTK
ncbi:hypothetical protein NLX86_01640 [Streptomyces sp. A3M-1-3]|nr:hypothetical protein [Streptomyces sp. A3M-1-3]MCP3816888.1 hypothetical protein [Streptomyces sp. A3M-1-3]